MPKKPTNSPEFNELIELERSHQITIGTNRNMANKIWFAKTLLGKVLNITTYLFIPLIIFIFIKYGFIIGFISLISLGIYSFSLQKIASWYVRFKVLGDEETFEEAFERGIITIRDNTNSEIIRYPEYWRYWVNDLTN